MHFELPAPSMTFDVALSDGARIRMRRHGNPDGVRLLMTHGNGFAADAYYPYWQHLLPKFDLMVFDFRNHGQNIPVEPSNHNYAQLSRDLERVVQEVKVPARPEADGRPVPFDVGAHRDEACHRDRLALGRAGPVRSARRAAARASPLCGDGDFREQADRMGAQSPPALCIDRRADERISAVAGDGALGSGRARTDGPVGAAQEPGRRRLRTGVRSRKRGDDLRAGDDVRISGRRQASSAGRSS